MLQPINGVGFSDLTWTNICYPRYRGYLSCLVPCFSSRNIFDLIWVVFHHEVDKLN